MMTIIYQNFSEINRKIAVDASYQSFGGGLGCHCGTISSVSAIVPAIYSASPTFLYYQVIDPSKEPIDFERLSSGTYKGYYVLSEKEIQRTNTYFAEKNLSTDAFSESILEAVSTSTQGTPVWVLSDVINYKSPARNSGIQGKIPEPNFPLRVGNPFAITRHETKNQLFIHTSEFADFLIRSKNGYVMESPVIQNPNHSVWGAYSLNRVWFWIPERHIKKSLNVWGQYGSEKFPSVDEWREIIFQDLNISSKSGLPPSIQNTVPKTIDKLIFNGGVFPDDKRFSQNAKEA